jgi:methionyl-tRNA formyltransferase
VAFFGTDEFSLASLKALHASPHVTALTVVCPTDDDMKTLLL